MQLYKFLGTPQDVTFLLQGCLKFTPIKELNDPSELLPNVIPEALQSSITRLRTEGYSDEDMIHLGRQVSLFQLLAPEIRIANPRTKDEATALIHRSFDAKLPDLLQELDMVAARMSSRVGLLCLTKRYDSLPMWAHYAANATGLVVEFRDLEEIFCGDDTGVLNHPIAVRYEREGWGMTFEPRSHESLFFAKFQDWEYEREVRVVRPLADCRVVTNGDRQVYLVDIPLHHVVRVILGWQMEPTMIKNMIDLVRGTNPRVQVVKATI